VERARKAAKAPIPSEFSAQVGVVSWADRQTVIVNGKRVCLGRLLFAVPNGAMLGGGQFLRALQVGRLKQAGMRVGVSDLVLLLPRGAYHGLVLEMKRGPKSPISDDQQRFLQDAAGAGYLAEVARGVDEGIAALQRYLGLGEFDGPGGRAD
jgi:hypothetical protein